MSEVYFSQFEKLLLTTKNPLGTSILLILAWIAASDGSVDDQELDIISEIAKNSQYEHNVQPLITLAQNENIKTIQLASEIIKQHFEKEKAVLFIELAIGVAVADKYLRPVENHILRFLADLLEIKRAEFHNIFEQCTGKKIPSPSDISKAEYWRTFNGSKQKSSESHQDSTPNENANSHLAQAYAILGLNYGATQEEIKLAYKRLAQANHPDKFAPLGKEAQAAAEISMQRINNANDYLEKHA